MEWRPADPSASPALKFRELATRPLPPPAVRRRPPFFPSPRGRLALPSDPLRDTAFNPILSLLIDNSSIQPAKPSMARPREFLPSLFPKWPGLCRIQLKRPLRLTPNFAPILFRLSLSSHLRYGPTRAISMHRIRFYPSLLPQRFFSFRPRPTSGLANVGLEL